MYGCMCFLCFCLCSAGWVPPQTNVFVSNGDFTGSFIGETKKKGGGTPGTRHSLNNASGCFCSPEFLLCGSPPAASYTPLNLSSPSLHPRFSCKATQHHSTLSAAPHQTMSSFSSSLCKIRPTQLRSQDRNHLVLLNHALWELTPSLIPKNGNDLFQCSPKETFACKTFFSPSSYNY